MIHYPATSLHQCHKFIQCKTGRIVFCFRKQLFSFPHNVTVYSHICHVNKGIFGQQMLRSARFSPKYCGRLKIPPNSSLSSPKSRVTCSGSEQDWFGLGITTTFGLRLSVTRSAVRLPLGKTGLKLNSTRLGIMIPGSIHLELG